MNILKIRAYVVSAAQQCSHGIHFKIKGTEGEKTDAQSREGRFTIDGCEEMRTSFRNNNVQERKRTINFGFHRESDIFVFAVEVIEKELSVGRV